MIDGAPQRLDRPARIVLIAIVAGGLAASIGVIHEQRGDILFEYPPIDEYVYVQKARAVASGWAPEPGAYWQPPGLIYVLAIVFRLAGPSLYWPRVLQALISAASCLILFSVARRLFSLRLALGAAAVLAANGAFVFSSTELLPAV